MDSGKFTSLVLVEFVWVTVKVPAVAAELFCPAKKGLQSEELPRGKKLWAEPAAMVVEAGLARANDPPYIHPSADESPWTKAPLVVFVREKV